MSFPNQDVIYYLPQGIFQQQQEDDSSYNVFNELIANLQAQPNWPNLPPMPTTNMANEEPATKIFRTGDSPDVEILSSSLADVSPEPCTSERSSFPGFERTWQPVDTNVNKDNRECNNDQTVHFRVVSYNLLCEQSMLANFYLYRHIGRDDQATCWSFRWENFKREFDQLDADIFCFQELQQDQYLADVKPYFQSKEFSGIYQRRPGDKRDGCAIMFRRALFAVENSCDVNYSVPYTYLDRDNIGLIAVLKSAKHAKSSKRLVVATTHLLFNPKRGDIKLAQLAMFLAHVEKAAYRGKDLNSNEALYHDVLLCGDFNMEPWSPMYTLLMLGELSYQGQPMHELSGQGKVGGRHMTAHLLPAHLGITNRCQLAAELQQRCAGGKEGTKSIAEKALEDWPPLIDITEEEFASATVEGNESSSVERRAEFYSRCTISTLDTTPAPSFDENGWLYHPFTLASVYRHRADAPRELTSYHADAVHVDYIFYTVSAKEVSGCEVSAVSEGSLKCREKLTLPTYAQFRKLIGRLPNETLSSDHIALGATFDWVL